MSNSLTPTSASAATRKVYLRTAVVVLPRCHARLRSSVTQCGSCARGKTVVLRQRYRPRHLSSAGRQTSVAPLATSSAVLRQLAHHCSDAAWSPTLIFRRQTDVCRTPRDIFCALRRLSHSRRIAVLNPTHVFRRQTDVCRTPPDARFVSPVKLL
ncbi:hypothetical protein OH76DRAFT_1234773 [Lentinus brumalis]|uniref:Uncharacterized protein n=1 Tax=Lentinus brumalis TaxID=2498619 RepID=A0A371CSI1_9APHY|nr:hypothetical protein OH76DRAFT_1234773 [Polyporus brumalis]